MPATQNRFVEAPQIGKCAAQIQMGVGKIWIQRKCLLKLRDGVLKTTQTAIRFSEIGIVRRFYRTFRNCLRDVTRRFAIAPSGKFNRSKPMQGFGMIWLRFKNPPIPPLRHRELTGMVKRQCDLERLFGRNSGHESVTLNGRQIASNRLLRDFCCRRPWQ